MKPSVSIKSLVNWYYGNYCTRKCYEDEKRIRDHYPKLQRLAEKLGDIKMTHQEFLSMMRADKTICDLSDEEWKRRKFSWKHPECPLCRKLGIG